MMTDNDFAPGELLATLPKNAGEELRISRTEFGGHQLLDVRAFTRPTDGSEGKATRKGLTLREATWRDLLPLLREALGMGSPEPVAGDPADVLAGDPWGQ